MFIINRCTGLQQRQSVAAGTDRGRTEADRKSDTGWSSISTKTSAEEIYTQRAMRTLKQSAEILQVKNIPMDEEEEAFSVFVW